MSNSEHAAPINLDARAYPFAEPKGKQLAFASITINDAFAINGVKIMNGEKGPFVAMPGAKDKEGNYRDICFPTTKELRAKLTATVMEAYHAAIDKGRAAEKPAPEAERPSAAERLNKAKAEVAKAPKAPKAEKPAPAKGAER